MAISVPNDPDQPADEAVTKSGERRALSVACGAHVLHDGYTNLIWIALPIWQAEFGLSYAAVGLLRMIYSGTMAGLQIPASYIAGRVGGRAVLAAGTGLCGLCYCLGLGHGYWSLVATLFLGGLGATTQHPIGSALVTRVFTGARALTAFGTYNFAGDAGKVLPPASATMLMLFMRSCLRMSAFEGKADIARTCGGQKAPEFDKEKGVSLHHHCVLTSCLINRGGFLMRMHNLLRRKSFCIAAAISCTLAAIAPAPAQSDIELQNVTAVSGIVTGNVQEVGFRAMI